MSSKGTPVHSSATDRAEEKREKNSEEEEEENGWTKVQIVSDKQGFGGDNKHPPLSSLLQELSDLEPIMTNSKETLGQKYVAIFVVVSLYWFVSITMVFLNKSLLSGQSSVDAPLFITWYQCVVTALACYMLSFLKRFFPNFLFSFPTIETNPKVMLKVLPLSLVFVAMITFNNLCLKYVGVSFYYIGRSLTTVFNVGTTYFFLGEKTSLKAVVCCAVIIIGFWLGVDQEGVTGTLSISGTIYGVLASLFVSLYAIYIKKVLPEVNNSVWLLTLYNNINAIILFIPMMVVFGEIPIVIHYENIFSETFWLPMTLAGIFGFAIGYVTGLQVKVTSPLTHNISGTAKAAAQTVMATQWNGEIKTSLWWLSNFVVLAGSAAYARVRQLEMASRSHQEKSVLPTKKGSGANLTKS